VKERERFILLLFCVGVVSGFFDQRKREREEEEEEEEEEGL